MIMERLNLMRKHKQTQTRGGGSGLIRMDPNQEQDSDGSNTKFSKLK